MWWIVILTCVLRSVGFAPLPPHIPAPTTCVVTAEGGGGC